MELYYSLTSPYARIVRVALLEKQLDDRVAYHVVDPWADDPSLMRVNPATRVPALITNDGTPITESLLMVHYLETVWPKPPLIPAMDRERTLATAGLAVGVIDAAVHTLLGRKAAGAEFDGSPLGQRRTRAMNTILDRLEEQPPEPSGQLGALTLAVALDYLDLRFPDMGWAATRPQLARWHEAMEERNSLSSTLPPRG